MFERIIQSRWYTLMLIAIILIVAQEAMFIDRPIHLIHLNLEDLGHMLISPLDQIFSYTVASRIWWAGSILMESCFAVAILAILFWGKGMRLGIGLALIALLHGLLWHLTIMPIPSHILWKFPDPTGEIAMPEDFWFSGHVAYVTLIALVAGGCALWLRVLAWLLVVLIILLVLSTRTHYSIDVAGAIFVGYSIYKFLGLDGCSKK